MKKIVWWVLLLFLIVSVNAQGGLEKIIVEKYYTATAQDEAKTHGSLKAGSVTYRIFADMKADYKLNAVFGLKNHQLMIATTTKFFNNETKGKRTGDYIDYKDLNDSTVALDSWVTIALASELFMGVPKYEDTDGSIIKRDSLSKTDGLMYWKDKGHVGVMGTSLDIFHYADYDSSVFYTDNAVWAIFGGMKGSPVSNTALIAQLTTDGQLSFELNLQLYNPKGEIEKYVAKNPQNDEFLFEGLTFKGFSK